MNNNSSNSKDNSNDIVYFKRKLLFDVDKYIKKVDINDVEAPQETKLLRKIDDEFIDCICEKELSKELLIFTKTVVGNFEEKDLTTFYNNMWTLSIDNYSNDKFKRRNKIGKNTIAYYRFASNTIFVLDKNFKDSIFHELFHMSTAKREKHNAFFGFSYCNLKHSKRVGVGINEGYTQLLSERYFPEAKKGTYPYLTYNLGLIESIIGKEKMESLYLNSNLYGLIDELRKYATYEDICKFITYTDYLVDNMHNRKISNKKLAIATKMFEFINIFILKLLINKYKMNRPSNEYEILEMSESIVCLINKLISTMKIYGKYIICSFENNESVMLELLSDLEELNFDFDEQFEKKKTL